MAGLNHKIPPPLLAAICGGFMWLIVQYMPTMALAAEAVLYLSLFVFFLGALTSLAGSYAFYKAKTTVNPLKPENASSLVCGGIFKYSRNPMYVGFVLVLLAWAIYLQSLWSLLGIAIYMAYIQHFQIKPEERALKKLFGSEFEAYCQRVGRWL